MRGVHGRPRVFWRGLADDLIRYAEQEFRALQPVKGAAGLGSEKDHRASLERQLGRPVRMQGDREAEPDIECPDLLAYLWSWFMEIAGRRSGGTVGPNPITHTDIASWSALSGHAVEPREVAVLLRLDDAMLASSRVTP